MIDIDPATNLVRLSHDDIAQYLCRNRTQLSGSEGILTLAKLTIRYLSLDAFADGPCRDLEALRQRIKRYSYMEYASRFWGKHAKDALLWQYYSFNIDKDVRVFLQSRKHLESSIQILEMGYPAFDEEHVIMIDPSTCQSVSSLQVAARYGLVQIVKSFIEVQPQSLNQRDF